MYWLFRLEEKMAKYDVEIVETSSRVITVEADSYKEAEDIAEYMRNNEEVILDYEDLEKVDYRPYPSPVITADNIHIKFDRNEKKVEIDGRQYDCRNLEDLMKAFTDYSFNYLKVEPTKPHAKQNIERER